MLCPALGSQRLLHFDLIHNAMSRTFCAYAKVVCKQPWLFIIVPIVTTVLFSVGILLRWPITDAFYLYTPMKARSAYEKAVFQQTWPVKDGYYIPGREVENLRQCQIIVTATDDGSVLRPDITDAILHLNKYIVNDIQIEDNGERFTYRTLCIDSYGQCFENQHVEMIKRMIEEPEVFGRLTFPKAKIAHHEMYLGQTLGGVVTLNGNGEVSGRSDVVSEAKAWMLIYQLRYEDPLDRYLSGRWERELERKFTVERLVNASVLIDVAISHSQTLDVELSKNGQNLAPRVTFCFVVLITFATLCTISLLKKDNGCYVIDWNRSAPWLAVAGVFSAGMGVSTAVGLLSLLKVQFCEVVAVMPFLVISVRLDNTFLMLSAMSHTQPSIAAESRIPDAMAEAAVSITITVLTDVISFAVGYLTDFPAVQLFCLYTCVAMMISFFYQLTFLLGLMVLHARNEEKGKHALLPCFNTVSIKQLNENDWLRKLFCVGSSTLTNHDRPGLDANNNNNNNNNNNSVISTNSQSQHAWKTGSRISSWFMDSYAPFLTNNFSKVFVTLLYVAYLAVAVYGCTQVREGLEPVNLLVENSYATKFYRKLQEYFWRYGTVVQFSFNNPGDVSDPSNRFEIVELVKRFAESEHGTGVEGLDFWLLEFDRFLPLYSRIYMDELSREQFFDHLAVFFQLYPSNRYMSDVHWTAINDTIVQIDAFRFTMAIRDFHTAGQQMQTLDQLRAIADQYPQYNISCYQLLWPFVDQYEQVLPNVFQELYSGMLCMVVIALLFIPNPLGTLWVTVAMASIDVGVIGYMTLWGLSIDCITMITLIMSIGFSVDFSAHIAYSYAINDGNRSKDRIRIALGNLGWPIVQGGLSTVLGVVVLADVQSYMFVAFCKTVLLIILIGVIHGIFFLPVFISVADLRLGGSKTAEPNSDNSTTSPPAQPDQSGSTRQPSRFRNLFDKLFSFKLPLQISTKGSVEKQQTNGYA
ncbi:Patched domain-containing protein 3 [Trichinella britovi]|uniref:Patched domain-containing protein 3 n=1 Tax=Trichinella britovi TaxID=45882 RepID=A0A0V1DJD9_TRIBR|nr:Patched domain-containing protein 3 [Trichinella britovi]